MHSCIIKSGADPGLPVAGGANPLGGAPTYDFAQFCEKLHEIEKILGRGAKHSPPPPKSATAFETLQSAAVVGYIVQGKNTSTKRFSRSWVRGYQKRGNLYISFVVVVVLSII